MVVVVMVGAPGVVIMVMVMVAVYEESLLMRGITHNNEQRR